MTAAASRPESKLLLGAAALIVLALLALLPFLSASIRYS